MAIVIQSQPTNLNVMSAYAPIIFSIRATGVPTPIEKVILCDVYSTEISPLITTAPVFLRTLTATNSFIPAGSAGNIRYFTFDIQDVVQEYLRGNQHNPLPTILPTDRDLELVNPNVSVITCRFRYSVINASGFLEQNLPRSFVNGLPSNQVIALNANLQQEDVFNLSDVIGNFSNIPKDNTKALLLTRFRNKRLVRDWDYTQFLTKNITGDSDAKIIYTATRKDGTVFKFGLYMGAFLMNNVSSVAVYPIPLGEKYLKRYDLRIVNGDFTWGGGIALNFELIESFFVQFRHSSNVLFTSDIVVPLHCNKDITTLRFLNSFGGFDDVHFKDNEIVKINSADYYQMPSTYPTIINDGGFKKINIDSNERLNLRTIEYSENNATWLSELLDSPKVSQILERSDGEPFQVPVNVITSEMVVKKLKERWVYEFSIIAEYSNHNIRQRG